MFITVLLDILTCNPLLLQSAKEGFKSMLMFSLFEDSDSASNNFENEVRLLSRTKFSHLYRYAAFENVDPVATSFYELIVLYANALVDVLNHGLDIRNTTDVLRAMKNVTYRSPRGTNISFDGAGDRISTYVVKDFDIDTDAYKVIFPLLLHI